MANNAKLELNEDKSTLSITWEDGHVTKSHVKRLRFHCGCERCVPSFSGMMPVDKDAFVDDMNITKVEMIDGVLNMNINEEAMGDHITTIPMKWLRDNCHCSKCMALSIEKSNIKFGDPKSLPQIPYSTLESKEGKFQCLKKVFDDGFCVIKNVPLENLIVLKVGEMFGHIRSTLYEKFFDVKYEPDPYNSAYTSLGLPYHQDLPYYEGMPGVQLLHAMAFDETIQGGESQLVDLFRVAEILREESREDFDALCRIPATFQTKDLTRPLPAHYQNSKTHIEVDYFGNVVSIHWNPGVEGTLCVRPEDEGAYYKAYVHFLRILKRPELEYLFRMHPGDLIFFNNRRMAHARKEYKTSEGRRHLQGCYINLDDMKSNFMVLAHQLGKEEVSRKCGNRSWY